MPTHRVTKGEFEFCEGVMIKEDGKLITLLLLKNRSGGEISESKEIRFLKSDVEELDSYDMLATIDTVGHEDEDDALIEHEKGYWDCGTCNLRNRNDAGYCTCGGTQKSEMLTWDGCFNSVCNVHV